MLRPEHHSALTALRREDRGSPLVGHIQEIRLDDIDSREDDVERCEKHPSYRMQPEPRLDQDREIEQHALVFCVRRRRHVMLRRSTRVASRRPGRARRLRGTARFSIGLLQPAAAAADITDRAGLAIFFPLLGSSCNCGLHAFVSIARSSTRTMPVRVARRKAMPFCRTGSM